MRQVSGFDGWGGTCCQSESVLGEYVVYSGCLSRMVCSAGIFQLLKYLNARLPSSQLKLPSQSNPHQHIISTSHNPSANMASQTTFQPIPPVRTNTVDSQSSGQMSPPYSPTSPTSHSSPTEQSFFGAITARVRGRSRSRSRDASRKRSKSPMMSPPRQITTQPQQTQYATIALPTQPTRPSLQAGDRRGTSGSDPWRGRHSNEWLFGNLSVRGAVKDLARRK